LHAPQHAGVAKLAEREEPEFDALELKELEFGELCELEDDEESSRSESARL